MGVSLEMRFEGLACATSTLHPMLHYAVVFLVIALVAGVLGFGYIAGTAAWIAKVCFLVFLVFAVLSFLKKGK